MFITECDWQRIDKADMVSVVDATRVIASDHGSAGTIEEILWHTETGKLYRRQWWSVPEYGEIWFKYIG